MSLYKCHNYKWEYFETDKLGKTYVIMGKPDINNIIGH